MKCRFKNVECEHAGEIVTFGCKEFGEKEGMHKHTVCYDDTIGRDVTKCSKVV